MAIMPTEKEAINSDIFRRTIDKYFHVKAECWGTHAVTGNKKRIDFLIYPREILREQSFPEIPIGVEIKPRLFENGHKKQVIELYKQAIDYRFTRFEMKNGPEFLPLILIYPPVAFFLEHSSTVGDSLPGHISDSEKMKFREGFNYLATRLMGKMFIGEFFLNGDPGCDQQFKIVLCGADYYRFNKGIGTKLNMNWGFETYETSKKEIQRLNLPPRDYESSINNIVNLIGI